jgi:alpha-galactosidase
MGAGELLLADEVILKSNETYAAPTVVAVYSNEGVNGASYRLHQMLRARANHPTNIRPRPITLNVWEAVYFDHNFEKLSALADAAAEIGVERFVLDDGWFGSRRDDKSGLGDWVVSSDVGPEGLGKLVDKVKSVGMEFGLWFEGEMVNADSDLYRAHPDWILHAGSRVPPTFRDQQVLDLAHEGAFEHVFNQVNAILSAYDIAYIKWDHNRVLTEAAHLGQAAVRRQVQAIYRMFDQLKAAHPGLEIESCASGGARIDLGMVDHADRFWTSDNNDALERQSINRYTSIVIPPELLGTHIGPTKAHSTRRTHSHTFRAVTALWGHAGLEWDLTEANAEERELLKSWAAYYKSKRALLHSGKTVRADQTETTSFIHGVVAADKSEAIFMYAQLTTSEYSRPANIRLTGLDDNAEYRVRVVEPAGAATAMQLLPPKWYAGVQLSGALLATVGLRAPVLHPEQAMLIEVSRV